jgi:NAD(P)-dependent dehydrogenase (short-subunit alcohol dehydrogenase family)
LFTAIKSHFGRLDVLVNSAAIFDTGDLFTVSLEDWQRSLDINLTAPFLCMQHAALMMRAANTSGVIINISDMGGLKGSVNYPQHSVAKAGLLMLTKIAARSFAPNIRVNAIVPGLIMQPPDMTDEEWHRLAQNIPLNRPGSAEDAARAVLYLITEDFQTGTILTIDGGEALV